MRSTLAYSSSPGIPGAPGMNIFRPHFPGDEVYARGWLPYFQAADGEDLVILACTVFDWSTRVTDGQTDEQTEGQTELRWLRCATAVPTVVRKKELQNWKDECVDIGGMKDKSRGYEEWEFTLQSVYNSNPPHRWQILNSSEIRFIWTPQPSLE